MTAIAAVLAFANPAMAQEITPTPVTPTPVTVAPDPVVTTPPVSDTTATPVDPLSPAATTEVAPVAAKKVELRATRTTVRSTRTVSRTAPQPRRVTAPASIASSARATTPSVEPVAPTLAPVDTGVPVAAVAPVAEPPAQPVPAPQPAPATLSADSGLEIAGAAGLGLLALLGIGAAFRRRSRRAEGARYGALDEPQFDQPMAPAAFDEPMREPAIRRDEPVAATAMAVPVGKPIGAVAAALPEGFDLSRFGPHVQAAYRGPTEDNSSLSLKHRLRRASAMDQMARKDATEAMPAAELAVPAPSPADAGTVVSAMRPTPNPSDGFMFGNGAVRPGLNPVTQD